MYTVLFPHDVKVPMIDALAFKTGVRIVAAQVEFENKIEVKLKAVYHIFISSHEFQALSTWKS